ncbi:MAG: hypothetical protein IPP48_14425 [Chitinophagaceae bacterium]|nr:hypothetical protein [Chitinophagaceae bacterium]
MQTNFTTERLQLEPLTHKHAAFIFELVNTSGWIKYIGDRNVYTTENAIEYIEKINNNEAIRYWVVNCIYENLAIGLVTLIRETI